MPIKADREYRDFRSAEFEPLEDSGFLVRGYATTFDDPYLLWRDDYEDVDFYEVIDRNALAEADLSDVIFLYNHTGMVYARNRKTGTLSIAPDDKGLLTEADLRLLADFGGGELYAAIKAGLIDRMSWAFTVRRDHIERTNKTVTRIIDEIAKVYDVSAVSIPADPNTSIATRAWIDGAIEQERAERLRRERNRLMLRIKTL